MVRVVRLERTVSWSQTRRDTNFAIPGYSISAMIPRRTVKIKFFLSVVIYVVKAAFMPFSAIGEKPAIARAARLCGLLSKQFMDRVYALPKQARYQLRYTRLLSFLSGWAYSPKPPALPTALHPVVKFLPIQTAYVSGLTFILTYILYINTAESAIFFSARLPHCAAISLSGTALLHISATRYIFNSLNTAKIAVAWYSCM